MKLETDVEMLSNARLNRNKPARQREFVACLCKNAQSALAREIASNLDIGIMVHLLNLMLFNIIIIPLLIQKKRGDRLHDRETFKIKRKELR